MRSTCSLMLVCLSLVALPKRAAAQAWSEPTVLNRSGVTGSFSDRSFGMGVALGGDWLMVGASTQSPGGALYIYDSKTLSPAQVLTPNSLAKNEGYGYAIAISGTHAIVGSVKGERSSVWFLELQDGRWSELQQVVSAGSQQTGSFGRAVAMAGDLALVGSPKEEGMGRVYPFRFASGQWQALPALLGSDTTTGDYFGLALAISGSTAVVGAPGNAYTPSAHAGVYVFELAGDTFQETAHLTSTGPDAPPLTWFGSRVALDGDTLLVGAPPGVSETGNGRAYVLQRGANGWTDLTTLRVASDTHFGGQVGIEGKTAWVSSFDATSGTHSIYLFEREADSFVQREQVSVAAGSQGLTEAALSGGTAVIGASGDQDAGQAYVFRNPARDPAASDGGVERDAGDGDGSASEPDAAVPDDAQTAPSEQDAGSLAPARRGSQGGCSVAQTERAGALGWWAGLLGFLWLRRRRPLGRSRWTVRSVQR